MRLAAGGAKVHHWEGGGDVSTAPLFRTFFGPLNGTLAAGGVLFSQRLLRGPGGPFVSFLKWKETDVGMT